MTWQIPARIILVNESAVDSWNRFEYILQTLTQVMTVPETHALVEHDIDLDVKFIARVICLKTLDALDGVREAHG